MLTRISLAIWLMIMFGLFPGCRRMSQVGGSQLGESKDRESAARESDGLRAFAALPPGCELMVIAQHENLQSNEGDISLQLGDYVRLSGIDNDRLQVVYRAQTGTIAPASVIPVADAHQWLVARWEQDPKDVRVLYALGRWYRRSDQLVPAARKYRAALEIEPKNPTLLNALGYALSKSQEWPAAIERYSAALEHVPSHLLALTNRAYVFYRIGEYSKAVQDCEAALQIDGQRARAWNTLGLVRRKQGDFDEALACYAKALDSSAAPMAYVHANRAQVLADQQAYLAACEAVATAIALDDGYLERKAIWREWPEAALEQSKDCGAAHLLLGIHLTQTKSWDEATRHLQAAIDNGIATHVPHLCLARQDLFHQRVKEATERIAIAAEKGPHSASVQVVRADWARLQGDLKAAADSIGTAIQLNPFDASLYQTRAELLLEQGDLNAAVNDLAMAVEIAPYRADLCRQLGEILLRQGNAEEALERLWTAVDIAPADPASQLALARGWRAFLSADSTAPDDGVIGSQVVEEAAKTAILKELGAIQHEEGYLDMLKSRPKYLAKPLAVIRPFTTVPSDLRTAPAADILAWYKEQGANTGTEVRRLQGLSLAVSSVAFSPDGERVLIASDRPEDSEGFIEERRPTARLLDLRTGSELRTFHLDYGASIVFLPDAQYIVASGDREKTLQLWDVASGKMVRKFEGHNKPVQSVACSPDGQHVLTGSSDATARLWSLDSGKEVRKFSGHAKDVSSVAFSPDGRHVLTGSWDRTARLWDVATGAEIRRFEGHTEGITSVGFSPDRRHVFTGSWDHSARLWDLNTGAEVRTFDRHADVVETLACSQDGQYLLTGSGDRTARLWNVATGKEVHQLLGHEDSVESVAFSMNGRHILTGSRGPLGSGLGYQYRPTVVRALQLSRQHLGSR